MLVNTGVIPVLYALTDEGKCAKCLLHPAHPCHHFQGTMYLSPSLFYNTLLGLTIYCTSPVLTKTLHLALVRVKFHLPSLGPRPQPI